ncbi:MAG: hypothetical protein H7A46_00945 [Verrucomicrobiales bacterium]|nr:hypothetical protein [Verrucomicrobiales bacterium]
MRLTQLKSGDLKNIVKLLEQKEALQAQIAEIDIRLAAFDTTTTVREVAPAPAKKRASRSPAKRKLSEEGRARIAEAARKRWAKARGSAVAAAAVKPPKAPKRAKATKPAKGAKAVKAVGAQPRKRGQLKEQIIGLVKAGGKTGVTVKEIAAKLGDKPDRIHVWFNATGKNVKEIKRIRPGTYAWTA